MVDIMASVASSTKNSSTFSYLCRLCLGNDEENMGEILSVANKVEFVTRMAVIVGDGLPTFICRHCLFELDSASNFITRCIENDLLFRSKHIESCPEESIKKENLEDYHEQDNNDQANEDEIFDDQSVNHQNVDDEGSDFEVTEATELQTDSPSDLESGRNISTPIFEGFNINEPSGGLFQTENALAKPINNLIKNNPINMYACRFCGDTFKTKKYCDIHWRSHSIHIPSKSGNSKNFNDNYSAKKPFVCSECNKEFQLEKRFNLHLLAHLRARSSTSAGAKPKATKSVAIKKNVVAKVRAVGGQSVVTKKIQPNPRLAINKPPVKKSPAKKSPVKKSPVKKSPVKKSPVKKSPVKKLAAKKLAAKTDSPSTSTDLQRTVVKLKRVQAATFPCLTCDETFPTSRAMVTHARCHEKKSTMRTFPCASCEKVFATKKAMVAHAGSHVKVIVHRCKTCSKRFADKTALKLHANTHTKLSRFKCGQCGEEFGSRKHLIHHKRFHADEMPYRCAECGMCFVDEVSLLCHFKVHAIKPGKVSVKREEHDVIGSKVNSKLTCDKCGRDFVRKAALVVHMRSHCGYKCSKCGEEFETKLLLVEHVPFHGEDNLYKCTACDSKFADKPTMLKHFKSHVKEEPAK